MPIDLPFIWAGIIAFAVLAYVILDGFDLGVGILFPFFPEKHEKDLMMNSVAPVWDGNETWLVLGGGGLLAVFPLAYSTILPALYAPIILMLLGLIFRGVAFEYRRSTQRAEHLWNWAFTMIFSIIVPALVLGCLYVIVKGLKNGHDARPFIAALGLFVLGYAGIGISFYPYIVPSSLTIWEAAAPDESLAFLLVGAVVLVPMILGYTAYAYWVFRGKLKPDEGYH